jgi:hypothetical protein
MLNDMAAAQNMHLVFGLLAGNNEVLYADYS